MNRGLAGCLIGFPILVLTLVLLLDFLPIKLRAEAITAPGTYGPGTYFLSKDISVAHGDGLVFTGSAFLDLRGHKLETTQTGNSWDVGILMQGENSRLTDRSGGEGRIVGFRVGAMLGGRGSKIIGVNLSGNRYIGVRIEADNVEVRGGAIGSIGGVTDEKYAIGIQVGHAGNCAVHGVRFEEIYPQSEYIGNSVGEGLPVNFSASSRNCTLADSIIRNKTMHFNTIGVFAGDGGGHIIRNNIIHNFSIGLAASSGSKSRIIGNTFSIDASANGLFGISAPASIAAENVIAGPYETPIVVRAGEGNVVASEAQR